MRCQEEDGTGARATTRATAQPHTPRARLRAHGQRCMVREAYLGHLVAIGGVIRPADVHHVGHVDSWGWLEELGSYLCGVVTLRGGVTITVACTMV